MGYCAFFSPELWSDNNPCTPEIEFARNKKVRFCSAERFYNLRYHFQFSFFKSEVKIYENKSKKTVTSLLFSIIGAFDDDFYTGCGFTYYG